jgi:hypothetical protein
MSPSPQKKPWTPSSRVEAFACDPPRGRRFGVRAASAALALGKLDRLFVGRGGDDAVHLRLPFFWRDSGPICAWPPPTPPVFASSFVLPGPGPDWQAEIAARNVARHEESLRVIAHYKERDRQREAAEARAANERQIERRRREGWGW